MTIWPNQDATWTTRDGRKLPIPQMDDQHLENTILYLRRTFNVNRYRRSIPGYPPMMNGDMAQLIAENEWESECERRRRARNIGDYPAFRALVQEHTRRLITYRLVPVRS